MATPDPSEAARPPSDDPPAPLPLPIPPLALTPEQAAAALTIGVRLLWSETNAGRIPCVRIGRRVVYPVAVLEAARLLAEGDGGTPGMGELLVVDVGGATTDVYSVARGLPSDPSVTLHGLPEPWAKRTVEGDLGVRHNVETLLDLCARFGVDADRSHAAKLVAMPHRLPGDDAEARFDGQLAAVAVRESVDRHVGRIETLHGPQGESRLQVGKDLSSLGTVIGTGGPIIHGRDPRSILRGACADRSGLPKPVDPALYLDADYLMFALGLLARREPRVASTLLRAHLRPI